MILPISCIAYSEPPPNFGPIQNLLYTECLVCHSNDGNSENPQFPRIAGQKENYLVTELKAFRDHKRRDADAFGYMYGPASSLSNNQIHLLAEYFSEKPTATNVDPGSPADMKAGKEIFENGIPSEGVPPCFACHGGDAQGTAMAPRLAGQWSTYIVKQLNAFKNGYRHEATMMPAVAQHLTAAQETDVADYLQGLQKD